MAATTDHDTVAVVASHVARLDADATAALVADLWAARGFETRREGGDVVATGRGEPRRIRVGAGEGATDPPDVVVSLRDGRGEHGAAPGARVVDSEGLAGMLRYAVDRETARALCERHLGAPPGALRPPVGERLRARLGRLRTAADRLDPGAADPPVVPASFLVGVLVLLAVGVVAGVALTGTPGAPSADAGGTGTGGGGAVEPLSVPESTPVGASTSSSPTPDPDAEPTGAPVRNASVVPGLTEDGIADLSGLAAAHARGLLGRSYTLWMDTYRPPGGDPDAEPVQFDTDVAVADDRYLVEENRGEEPRERLRTVYHDGADWYVANETGDGRRYERVTLREPSPPPSPNPDSVALGLVADYLSTPETAVEGRIEGGEGEPTRYRLVGRGTPPPMDEETVRNYTAVALVDRDGLVRDLTVTYTRITDEGRYRVRQEWTYGYLGETTVEPPAWYVERFGSDADTETS
jgi:hypothetical protein